MLEVAELRVLFEGARGSCVAVVEVVEAVVIVSSSFIECQYIFELSTL